MITLAIEGSVAKATLSRPPVNAINEEWLDALEAVLDAIEKDENVSVLWIRSDGRAFCAGADLDFMRSRFGTGEGRKSIVALVRRLQKAYARIEAAPVVSVAEIGGAAMGGGFELALACDLRVVSETAKLGLPEARLGLLPGAGGTQRLTRICGDAVARRLILGAEVMEGATALALGAVHWAVPALSLEPFTEKLVRSIADLPRGALGECKACIAAALDGGVDGYQAELDGTLRLLAQPETQARVKRFFERGG